jgi:hypothetical protein
VQTEVELLLLASRLEPGPEVATRCRELLEAHAATADWGYVVDQAYRHRVLPLMARTLGRLGLFDDGPRVPMRELYTAHHLYTRQRNTALLAEAQVVLGALADAGLLVAVRKGGYLAPEVYRDIGCRPMSDLDLLVQPDTADGVTEVLGTLGYREGRLAASRRDVVPFDRAAQVFARLHGNTRPPLVRPTSDPYVEAFVVDLCVQQLVPRSGMRIPNDDLASRTERVRLHTGTAWVLRPAEFLIDLLVHLYKESTVLRYIHLLKHQRLIQYVDVLEYVSANRGRLSWDDFLGRVDAYGIAEPAYFALAHAARLRPGVIPDRVVSALAGGCGPDVLDAYGAADLGSGRRWDDDFMTRFFAAGRTIAAPATASPF